MGTVEHKTASEVSQLLNTSGVDLILSDLLNNNSGRLEQLFSFGVNKILRLLLPAVSQFSDYFTWISAGANRIVDMDNLHSQQRSVGWGLGATQQDQLSKRAGTPALIRLYQLLLFTMPGTPVFTYGDEIGLQAQPVGKKMGQMWKCFPSRTAATERNVLCLFFWAGWKTSRDGLGYREGTKWRSSSQWDFWGKNVFLLNDSSEDLFATIKLLSMFETLLTLTGEAQGLRWCKEVVQIPQWSARQRARSPPRWLLPSLLLCLLPLFSPRVGPEREIHNGCQLGSTKRDTQAKAGA